MQFKDLIQSAFGGFSEAGATLPDISRYGLSISAPQPSSSTVVNLLSSHKLLEFNQNSADASISAYEIISSLGDEYENTGARVLNENVIDLLSCLCDLTGFNMNAETGTATTSRLWSIDGVSPEFVISKPSHDIIDISGCFDLVFELISVEGVAKWTPSDLKTWSTDVVKIPTTTPHEYVYAAVDDCIDAAAEAVSANEALALVIEQASRTGEITVSAVNAICDGFMGSTVVSQIKSVVAGYDRLSSLPVLALISTVFKNNGGDYSGGDTFTPVITPNFSTSIVGVIASLLVTVISGILAVIFSAVAGIVALLASLISSVVSFLRNNFALTNAAINANSDIPAYNLPLTTIEVDNPRWEMAECEHFGCLAIDDSSSPIVFLLAPTAYDESGNIASAFCQCFVRPQASKGAHGNGSATVTVPSSGKVSIDSVLNPYLPDGNWQSDDISYFSYNFSPSGTGRQTMSDNFVAGFAWLSREILGNPIFTDLYPMPQNLIIDLDAVDDPRHSKQLSFQQIYVAVNIAMNNDLSIHSSVWRFILSLCLYGKIWEGDVPITPGSVLRWSTYGYGFDSYDSVYEFATANGSNPTTVDQLMKHDFDIMIKEILKYNRSSYRSRLSAGYPLLDPNVTWPSLSKSALLTGLFVTAISAVTVAAVTVSFKKWRKRRAVTRLVKRQADFDAAEKAVAADPTNKKARQQLVKANRKLGKAWSKAGKAGISSYNGFATGSSTIGDPLTFTDKVSALVGGESSDTALISQADKIIELISG